MRSEITINNFEYAHFGTDPVIRMRIRHELDPNLAQNPVLRRKENFKKIFDSFNNRRQIVQIALSNVRIHKKVEYLGTDQIQKISAQFGTTTNGTRSQLCNPFATFGLKKEEQFVLVA